MAVLHNYRQSSLMWLQKAINEANQWVGEPCLVLSMWNPQNAPANGISRCPHCWDTVYGNSEPDGNVCPYCYGTGWEGGIRKGWFINAVKSNPAYKNQVDKKMGRLAGADAVLLLPGVCDVWEFDYALFINGGQINDDGSHTPVAKEAWKISAPPQIKFLKDGSGNYSIALRAGEKTDVKAINMSHPITNITFDSVPDLSTLAYFAPSPAGEPESAAPISSK